MIWSYFDFHALLERTKAVNDDFRQLSSNVTEKILPEAQENGETTAASQEAWRQYSEKVWEKVSEDTLNNALVHSLVSQLSQQILDANDLQILSDCALAIPQLREVNLYFLRDCIPSFKKIRQQNPNTKWNLYASHHKLDRLNDSEILDGLRGSLKTAALNDQEDIECLRQICKQSRPDFHLELTIRDMTSDFQIPHLVEYTPILERLVDLTALVYRG